MGSRSQPLLHYWTEFLIAENVRVSRKGLRKQRNIYTT